MFTLIWRARCRRRARRDGPTENERHAYATGLHRLNRFIRHTCFDWSRRHWIGRTIRGVYIKIQPDTYHPSMVRELFRYMLQLDFDEQTRAATNAERPRFELLPLEMIVAIDAMQSLNGIARPFACWADWRDIFERGIRYDIPEIGSSDLMVESAIASHLQNSDLVVESDSSIHFANASRSRSR